MHFVLSALVALLALLDLMLGVGFLVNPAASGADFGLSAVDALNGGAEGLSAMRADFTAFFLVAAGFMGLGAWRRRGDVLTVPLGSRVALIEIISLPDRRGSPREAQACYRMLDPALDRKAQIPIGRASDTP